MRTSKDREWVVSEVDEWGDLGDQSMHETLEPARAEFDKRSAAGESVLLERWDSWWDRDGVLQDRSFIEIAISPSAAEAFARARAEGGQS